MTHASIIIPLFNGESYITRCLEAVKAEIEDGDEVLIVDNASTDQSVSLVKNNFSWAQLIQLPENIGFAAGCNRGAEQAKGEFLLFLNQDTLVQPGWLVNLLNPYLADPSIGLVTSKLLLMDQPGKINLTGQIVHFTGLAFQRGWLASADSYTEPGPVQSVSGAAFAIRHSLWSQLGGFDDRFFTYYEETDLCWRATRLGFHSWYEPNAQVLHDQPLTVSERSVFYSERNRWWLLYKHWKPITRFLLFPSLLLAEFVELSLLITKGRKAVKAKLRAVAWWITNIGKLRNLAQYRHSNPNMLDWSLLASCASHIQPQSQHVGLIGRWITWFANFLFQINYSIALWFMKKNNL
jgi:GT2 family glycosyltransferase